MRCIIAALVLVVSAASLAVAGETDGRLDVYWVDVEGGGATLIVTPMGESVLIDTGNPGRRDADRIVRTAVNVAGLTRIDHLIITHYHRDHYGGASQLAKMIPLGHVYDNGRFENMPDDPGRDYFGFNSDTRRQIKPGDVLGLKQRPSTPQLRVQCLGARQEFMTPPEGAKPSGLEPLHKPKDRDGSDNANSVVMLLSFGDFQFLHTGDLTWNREKDLVVPVNLIGGEVDVYQVAHHGLDSSNNPVLLRAIKPTVAIMANGTRKGCAPEVFANLTELDSLKALFQVHKNLRPDGEVNNTEPQRIANHEEQCEGHGIVLKVEPDGKSYQVAIPAHKHSETFQTK